MSALPPESGGWREIAGTHNGDEREMVTAMTEQSGANDPSERPASDRQAAGRSGGARPGPVRPRQGTPGTDLFGELQRWFIRQSARNMKREIGGQVRRTLGGSGRADGGDVWGTATTEIPPEIGESPECQWCPICRAARQMRESGPGLGGQLTGAGAAVASAVQDAMGALDSLLSKTAGPRDQGSRQADAPKRDRAGAGYSAEATGWPAAPPSAGPPSAAPPSAGPPSAAPADGLAARRAARRPRHRTTACLRPRPACPRRAQPRRPARIRGVRRPGRTRPIGTGTQTGRGMGLTIGVDVGGTKVAAGVVDDDGQIVEKLKRDTPAANPDSTIDVIASAVNELQARYDVAAVGIGAAGFVDQTRSTVGFAPNLAWRDEPVKKLVEERIGRPVVVENDANAAAWAEARLGAARGEDHVMLITVGTGIGAGIVFDGSLYRGRFGMAGEPGHYRVVPDGRLAAAATRAAGSSTPAGAPWSRRRASSPGDRLRQPCACCSWPAAALTALTARP